MMSILLPAEPDAPLDQGDVLQNVVTAVAVAGAGPAANPPGTVLVLSRACNANRDEKVIVAPVTKCDLADVGDLETLKDFLDFFRALRDGDGRPDTFYLGEMASGSLERFVAKFDVLHTIRIPGEEQARRQFLADHRRFSLAIDFKRDLHQRLFRAFASLGFDDDKWWSDEDLKFLVEKGRTLQRLQEAQIESAKGEMPTLQMASGERKGENKAKTLVKEAEKDAARTNELLEPLLAEHKRRFGPSPGPGAAAEPGADGKSSR